MAGFFGDEMKNFYLMDEITNQTVTDFVEFLKTVQNQPFNVMINSGGGDIFAALAISNLIKNRAGVTAKVEGLAASAATVIICGAEKVIAAKNSLLMCHLPLAVMADLYNEVELEKVKNSLVAIKNSLIETYTGKLKMDAAAIEKMLLAEKYMSAAEAKEIGLVDEISDEEVEMKVDSAQKILYVNNIAFSNIKIPQEVKRMDTKTSESENLMKSYRASVLAAERLRIKNLNALKNETPEINSIIDAAIENGQEVEEIQPFLNAITKVQKNKPVVEDNFEKLAALIRDNMNSGAENVQASTTPPPTEEDKQAAQADLIAKFANQNLKVGVK